MRRFWRRVGGWTIGDKCLRRRAADLKKVKKELAEDFLLQPRSLLLLPFSKRVHTHTHAHEKSRSFKRILFFFQNLKKQIDFFKKGEKI